MAWTGNILKINLISKKVTIEKLSQKVYEATIGGKGLGAYLLNRDVDPKVDPISPENKIIIVTGPAQGPIPIAGRYCIVTKSPHSEIFIDSHVGGYLGPELKFAGYDAAIIEGRSEKPSYLVIKNDDIQIMDATHLWGQDIIDTTDQIVEEVDPKARVIAIGPAGENMVHIAATNSDYYRTAARGGIGMLFGSKNLKAVAVRGTGTVDVHDPDAVANIRRSINQKARKSRNSGHQLPKIGTSWLVTLASARDQLPTLNYQAGTWEHAEDISGDAIEEKHEGQIKRKPCYRCSLACAYVIDTDYPWAKGKMVQHPEYESLALLGSNLGIANLETIMRANHLCNILGMDTISTGSSISWFMEAAKHNKVPQKYKNEIIHFGDEEGVLDLINKIAHKQGVGEILSQGVRRAADIFGNGTDHFAVHIKGLELPAWDPRGKLGLGLSYITSNVGGSHLRGWPVTTKVPEMESLPVVDSMIEQQDLKILKDSMIMCHFTHSISPGYGIKDSAEMYEALTGVPSTEQSMRDIAQYVWMLSRKFNVAAWGPVTPRENDILPARLMVDGLPSGIAKGRTSFISQEDMNKSLDYFYKQRGCLPSGIPKNEVPLVS